jgi:hypothetical protein
MSETMQLGRDPRLRTLLLGGHPQGRICRVRTRLNGDLPFWRGSKREWPSCSPPMLRAATMELLADLSQLGASESDGTVQILQVASGQLEKSQCPPATIAGRSGM